MTDYRANVQKAIELFGSRWGKHTQYSFVAYAPTKEELTKILENIYDPHNAPYRLQKAFERFRAHVQMDSYPDYRLGYLSEIFKNDVISVLNAQPVSERKKKVAKNTEQKRQVMTLGNRLVAKGVARSAALVQAWAMVKNDDFALAA